MTKTCYFCKSNKHECPSDTCEWNPTENRLSYCSEHHEKATWVIGAKGQYRLCDVCANLPRFKRYRIRRKIK